MSINLDFSDEDTIGEAIKQIQAMLSELETPPTALKQSILSAVNPILREEYTLLLRESRKQLASGKRKSRSWNTGAKRYQNDLKNTLKDRDVSMRDIKKSMSNSTLINFMRDMGDKEAIGRSIMPHVRRARIEKVRGRWSVVIKSQRGDRILDGVEEKNLVPIAVEKQVKKYVSPSVWRDERGDDYSTIVAKTIFRSNDEITTSVGNVYKSWLSDVISKKRR